MKKVGIVMGSDSDLPILRKAMDMLDTLGVPYETHIYSAHRTPVEARDFAVNARANGFGCIIAAAGMAAHLAGAIAANTTLPVIGIPCKGGMMDGLDALIATVATGMPEGICTVASRASSPSIMPPLQGMPMTGRVVLAAMAPARWAAIPAAAMMQPKLLARAFRAKSRASTGVRWAE